MAKRKKATIPPTNLRIGDGEEEGFTNYGTLIDVPTASVDRIHSVHHFHRFTQSERFAFMDDAFRILKPGAQITIIVPYWSAMQAVADPLAQWPPICESSFMVYSKGWREAHPDARVRELGITCDFGGAYGYGHQLTADVAVRNEEYGVHARRFWVNSVEELHITLTKPHDPVD